MRRLDDAAFLVLALVGFAIAVVADTYLRLRWREAS